MSTSSRFLSHARLKNWFRNAKAQIRAPRFEELAERFERFVSEQRDSHLNRLRQAEEMLSRKTATAKDRETALSARRYNSQALHILTPALRYVRKLRMQVRLGHRIKDPLMLTHFLASRALGVAKLALKHPLTDQEVFATYAATAQIKAAHMMYARWILRLHGEFFGLSSQDRSYFFDPRKRVPTEADLGVNDRLLRRCAVLKKIKDSGLLTREELALIA